MAQNLQNELVDLLRHEENLVVDGHLNKNKIIELGLKVEPQLISLLIKSDTFKKHFFQEVEEVLVFDKIKFQRFVNNKSFLPDSYTAFKNKIGLIGDTDDLGSFISPSKAVVLAWPHKDCILEGGQTKEDQKRNEIFWNETLAPDNIDRLLDAKALTNFKKFDKDGAHIVNKINGDENLIIKGNNLLALSSLLRTHRGKIKLIYIDPPYNTGSDSFQYNDHFNHSTWLTFMKNRLEIAIKLLKPDGVLFISCDDNELGHLKVLMDEFSAVKYESIFHIKVRHENRILRQDIRYQQVIEHLLCYAKPNFNPRRIPLTKNRELDYQFNVVVNENSKPVIENINGYEIEIYKKEDYKIEKVEDGLFKEYNIRGSLITQSGSASEFYELFLKSRKPIDGLGALYKVLKMGERGDGLGYRFIRQPFDDKGLNGFYYQGKPVSNAEDKGNPYPNYFDFEKEFNQAADEGGVTFKNGKKPEKFLAKIFEISNIAAKDIVLDFHLGSGSTAAVAHKLGLNYIGIEQLQSQIDLSVSRLSNVINKDQTGISKDVNWQGGGSFVYAELMQYNQVYIEKIQDAKSKDELIAVWNEMQDKAFLSYQFDKKIFNERLEVFMAAPIAEMKHYLFEILDKNQLYVNYSEINDETFKVSEEEKGLNREFYGNSR